MWEYFSVSSCSRMNEMFKKKHYLISLSSPRSSINVNTSAVTAEDLPLSRS